MQPKKPKSVRELFETQFALASDEQLTAAGVTELQLARRLDAGDWTRPCPGVVALVGAPPDWRQTAMAVTLGRRRSVVGLGGAARIHGLDGFTDHEQIDAFVERGARRSLPVGVTAHSSRRLKPSDITTVQGIRVTSIATTLLQCAAYHEDDDRTAQALDDALRKGKAAKWFVQTIERWQGKGVRGPNELRALLQSRVGQPIPLSWFQRLAQRALEELGAQLEHEVPVYDGNRLLATLDLCDVELKCGLECQSWEHHSTPAAQQHDLERKRRLTAMGWSITEMWWFDLDRMDAVYDDFQLARERQRRLLARSPEPSSSPQSLPATRRTARQPAARIGRPGTGRRLESWPGRMPESCGQKWRTTPGASWPRAAALTWTGVVQLRPERRERQECSVLVAGLPADLDHSAGLAARRRRRPPAARMRQPGGGGNDLG